MPKKRHKNIIWDFLLNKYSKNLENAAGQLRNLIEQNPQANINAVDKETGCSPILWACEHATFDIYSVLSQAGAEINVNDLIDKSGYRDEGSPSELNQLTVMLSALLKKGAPSNVKNKSGKTTIEQEARSQPSRIRKGFLNKISSGNAKGMLEKLVLSAMDGAQNEADFVSFFEKNPTFDVASLSNSDVNKVTLLHFAVSQNYEQLVAVLLDKGANPFAIDENNRSVLDYSYKNGNMRIFELVTSAQKTYQAFSPKMGVALLAQEQLNQLDKPIPKKSKAKLKEKEKIRELSPIGAFTDALNKNNEKEALKLVNEGLDTATLDKDGFSPFHLAIIQGSLNIIAACLKKKADPNAPTKLGMTPLALASHHKKNKVIEALLKAGADPLMYSSDGLIPYRFVKDSGLKVQMKRAALKAGIQESSLPTKSKERIAKRTQDRLGLIFNIYQDYKRYHALLEKLAAKLLTIGLTSHLKTGKQHIDTLVYQPGVSIHINVLHMMMKYGGERTRKRMLEVIKPESIRIEKLMASEKAPTKLKQEKNKTSFLGRFFNTKPKSKKSHFGVVQTKKKKDFNYSY